MKRLIAYFIKFPIWANALIVITGEIDLASIGSIAKNMHIDGLDQLHKLKEKKYHQTKVVLEKCLLNFRNGLKS